MSLIAHIESTVWAMLPTELDKIRVRAVNEQVHLDKLISSADLEKLGAPAALATRGGERLPGTRYASLRDDIAVIDLQGPMFTSGGFIDEILAFYFGGTSTKALARDIQAAVDNPGIKAIVLNVNSPGGEAFGIHELSNLIYKSRSKKPIKSYVYGYGASAAFFAAVGADEVICDKQAFLGSIGVVAGWADFSGFYEKLGIAYEEVTSSNAPYKRLDIRKPEERAVFMAEIDGMEKVFIDFVAKARGVGRETVVSQFGQGAVMAGHLAVKAGMADRTGDFESVIAELKKQVKKAAKVQSFGAENSKGELKMGFKEEFKSFAAKLGFSVTETDAETDSPAAAAAPAAVGSNIVAGAETAKPTAEQQKMAADLAAAQSELAKVKAEKLAAEADRFIGTELSGGRMTPAETESFKSLYLQAANDDAASPLAEGSRLGNLKAIQEKRKPHGLLQEQLVPNTGARVLANDESEEAKLNASVEEQAAAYVGTVAPNLKAVK